MVLAKYLIFCLAALSSSSLFCACMLAVRLSCAVAAEAGPDVVRSPCQTLGKKGAGRVKKGGGGRRVGIAAGLAYGAAMTESLYAGRAAYHAHWQSHGSCIQAVVASLNTWLCC